MESELSLLYLAIGSKISSAILVDNVPVESNKSNTDKVFLHRLPQYHLTYHFTIVR